MPIHFPKDELKRILDQASEVAQIALNLTALDLYGNIKEETPIDHGKLRGNWDIKQTGDLAYRIYNNTEYALAVHDGSKPHWIQGKAGASYMGKSITGKKGMLFWPGAAHPVWRVHHPGYKGNPFTKPAIAKTEARLDEFTQMALRQSGAA